MSVADIMKTEGFARLDSKAKLDEAIAELREASVPVGVIVRSDGAPIGLVTNGDLERAREAAGAEGVARPLEELRRWLPPLVRVERQAHMKDIVESPQLQLFEAGARGIVVMGNGKIDGILTREEIVSHLALSYRPSERLLGAYQLSGTISVPSGTVVCAREGCGADNMVEGIDPDNLPWCVNNKPPHRLEIGWV